MGSGPLSADKLATVDLQALFKNFSQGQSAMDLQKAVPFLAELQKQVNLQPRKTNAELASVFQKVQQNGVLTQSNFVPIFESWLKSGVKSKPEIIEPSPMSAFYSHPVNKTYEVKVPIEDVRYVKIGFDNPDDRPKTLKLLSEDDSVLFVRKSPLVLPPRVGRDYIRIKFIGKNKTFTNETRLALLHSDTDEVEELLLFRVITEAQRPVPGELLEPARLQTPVNPNTDSG